VAGETVEKPRKSFLILFRVGEYRLAVEAFSIQYIAGVNWTPQVGAEEEDHDRIVEMAAVLRLPPQEGKRTIVIDTPSGQRGFVVDSISNEEIILRFIEPVPPLLEGWIKPTAITGFLVEQEAVIGVVDFHRVDQAYFGRMPSVRPKGEQAR
jgi:chemotaxis signal transduction protein